MIALGPAMTPVVDETAVSSRTISPKTFERGRWNPFAPVAVVIGLAHLPLLLVHAQRLWGRPHYQCFPFMLAAAFLLAARAWPQVNSPGAKRLPKTAAIVAAGSWLTLLAALIFNFPWPGMLAALMLLTAWCLARGGIDYLRRFWPAGLMLALLLHPPWRLEQPVITKMQSLAVRASSPILDALQVPHLVLGNVIETANRRLLIEEACSGIDSLVAVLVSSLFLLFWLHRTWLHALLLLASAVVWVVLANVLRIVTVAYLDVHWQLDISAGWRHDLAGVVLFAFALCLAASTDQLLRFALGVQTAAPRKGRAPVPARSISPTGPWRLGNTGVVLGVAYGLLLALQLAPLPATLAAAAGLSRGPELPAIGQAVLPTQWGGWRIESFEVVQREPASPSGPRSQIWHYRGAIGHAELCLDYPFPSWHSLEVCYQGGGWTVARQSASSDADGYLTKEFVFRRALGRTAFLIYQMFDDNGEPVVGVGLGLGQHFDRGLASLGTVRRPAPAAFQVQLFIECDERLEARELNEARTFFKQAAIDVRREVVRTRVALTGQTETHPHD